MSCRLDYQLGYLTRTSYARIASISDLGLLGLFRPAMVGTASMVILVFLLLLS